MKDLISKEHYCCKIHALFINDITSNFMIFQKSEGEVYTINGVQMT